MSPRLWLSLGALLAAAAVGIGAFGAHGLPKYLESQSLSAETLTKRLQDFDTGARYHMYHALALVLLGLAASRGVSSNVAGWAFVVGILLFSGSLYLLVLTGQTKLGMVVPIGGVAFIVGWLAFALAAFRSST